MAGMDEVQTILHVDVDEFFVQVGQQALPMIP